MRYHPDYAGPALRFQRYAKGLASRQVDLRVFTGRWSAGAGGTANEGELGAQADTEAGTLDPPDSVDGIPVQRVRLKTGEAKQMRAHYDRALAGYLSGTQPRPEVLQLLTLATRSALWLSRIRSMKIPIVYTHTMMARPSLGAARSWFDRAAFRLVDCAVASSTVMRDQLLKSGVKTRVEVIPNGVDLDRFSPVSEQARRSELRAKLGLPDQGELLLFLGGFLAHRKGLDLLADAWGPISTAYPNAKLVLVGPHHDTLRPVSSQAPFLDQVKTSLARSGAGDRVIMTGRVQNVEDYLAVADVFVFPSRREGMPNVVAEAYACGAPTVMAPFIGLPEEFGEAGDHYVMVDHSAPEIAAAVKALLGDPGRRAQLARAGRDLVERTLGLGRSLDRYAALYWELATGRASPGARP